MTFNELTGDIDFLCGTTSASYPIAAKTRNINIAYNDVSRLIWESSDKWQYDDSNATTLPRASATLVHAQQDYELPSTAQRIRRIEVLDSGGDFRKVTALDETDIQVATSEYQEVAGLPLYYDIEGRSVILYPKPSSAYCTLTNGLKIIVDRDITEFPVTATTTQPGFAKSFHRLLSLGASIDFVDDSAVKDRLVQLRDRLEKGLKSFYSHRGQELPTKIMPKNKKFWRQYI